MSPPTFAHPEWTHVVTALIACAIGGVVAAHLRKRRRLRILGAGPTSAAANGRLRDAALVAALCAVGVAALGPHVGERAVAVPSRGLDVVFLVDVSRSMEARDAPPTRLDRARRAVEELIGRLEEGDRAALVAFAERPLVLAPLTPDRVALTEILAGVEAGLIEPADSNIARGIEASVALFEARSERPRAVVLASDGEDRDAESDRGAAIAARGEVRVLTLAIGGAEGVHVPFAGGFLRDRRGDPVVTRRHTAGLEALANATGGRALVADEWGRFDFDAAARSLRQGVGQSGETVLRRVAAARVIPFAAIAFAILWAEMLPPVRLRRRVAPVLAASAGLLATVFLIAPFAAVGERAPEPPDPVQVERLEGAVRAAPRDARARIDLGLALLARGDHAEAAREFLAATVYARDAQVAATAQYDLGVAALRMEDWPRARDAFFEALVLDPEDEAARFNLEWTLVALGIGADEPDPALATAEAPSAEDSAPGSERSEPEPAESTSVTAVQPAPDDALDAEERRAWFERIGEDARPWLRVGGAVDGAIPTRDPVPAW